MIEMRSLDGAGRRVSFAKTVKILEGSAIIVTVSARPWESREKKLYIGIKNGYPNKNSKNSANIQSKKLWIVNPPKSE
jgi:hypothetical protein